MNYTFLIEISEDLLRNIGLSSGDDLDLPTKTISLSKYAYDSSNLINTDTINESISKDLFYLKNQMNAIGIKRVFLNRMNGTITYVIY